MIVTMQFSEWFWLCVKRCHSVSRRTWLRTSCRQILLIFRTIQGLFSQHKITCGLESRWVHYSLIMEKLSNIYCILALLYLLGISLLNHFLSWLIFCWMELIECNTSMMYFFFQNNVNLLRDLAVLTAQNFKNTSAQQPVFVLHRWDKRLLMFKLG